MRKRSVWSISLALLIICSMLLSACGGDATPTTGTGTGATTTDTPAAGGAAPTDTTVAGGAGAATDTPAAAAATDTPAEAAGGNATATTGTTGGGAATTFDPAAYKKNAVEPGATLRVSSWGDTSEQQVNKDALARFNQVYPDVKITYEP